MFESNISPKGINISLNKVQLFKLLIFLIFEQLILSELERPHLSLAPGRLQFRNVFLKTLYFFRGDRNQELIHGDSEIMDQVAIEIIFDDNKIQEVVIFLGDSGCEEYWVDWIDPQTIVDFQPSHH